MLMCVLWEYCWDVIVLFSFKQKTAYEMRISDWSSDVCSSDLRHPELVRAGEGHVPGSIGEDRAIVIAVRRRNVAAPDLRLEAVLAHQPPDFLMVDDDALVPERGPHAAVSVGLEGVADGGHGRHDPGFVSRQYRQGVGEGKSV